MQTLEQEILMYKKIDINFYNQRRTAMDNFNISKLSCIVQPEIAEDHREEQAKVLLTIAIENACAVLSNSDD